MHLHRRSVWMLRCVHGCCCTEHATTKNGIKFGNVGINCKSHRFVRQNSKCSNELEHISFRWIIHWYISLICICSCRTPFYMFQCLFNIIKYVRACVSQFYYSIFVLFFLPPFISFLLFLSTNMSRNTKVSCLLFVIVLQNVPRRVRILMTH